MNSIYRVYDSMCSRTGSEEFSDRIGFAKAGPHSAFKSILFCSCMQVKTTSSDGTCGELYGMSYVAFGSAADVSLLQ